MNNDDIRRFLLAHRRIMSDAELAEIAGVTKAAINQFINKIDRPDGGNKFRITQLHRALGLEVTTMRTFKPAEQEWHQAEKREWRLEEWTLQRPQPRRR